MSRASVDLNLGALIALIYCIYLVCSVTGNLNLIGNVGLIYILSGNGK